MKDIIFKKDCTLNGKDYFEGNIIKKEALTLKDLKEIWKLNERGFIEPIKYKDFYEFSNKLKETPRNKELERNNIDE